MKKSRHRPQCSHEAEMVPVSEGVRGIRKWVRITVRVAVLGLALVFALLTFWLARVLVPVISDPSPGFMERKGQLVAVRETATWTQGDDVLTELTLTSSSGLMVDVTVRVPRGVRSARPTVLLLAGQGTGRDAVRYIADSRGVVAASVSYPYRGDKDAGTLALLLDLPQIQRSFLDTIPAVLLAADWLMQQPYVDPSRVELAGGSLGAFLVSVPGALDTRFRRVWLVHGGGDPAAVLEHGLRENIEFAPARRLAARLLAAVACGHHLKPEKWVGKISPRPVIVVSALDDESIPRASVEILHQALAEPSEVIWMSTAHIRPNRADIIEAITDLAFSKIMEDSTVDPP